MILKQNPCSTEASIVHSLYQLCYSKWCQQWSHAALLATMVDDLPCKIHTPPFQEFHCTHMILHFPNNYILQKLYFTVIILSCNSKELGAIDICSKKKPNNFLKGLIIITANLPTQPVPFPPVYGTALNNGQHCSQWYPHVPFKQSHW